MKMGGSLSRKWIAWLSKKIIYPIWDLWDDSLKLKELSRLESSQWLKEKELLDIQEKRFGRLLNYALEHSPHYKNMIREYDICLDGDFLKTLSQFPVTKKSDVRENLIDFLSTEYKQDQLVIAKTGGSTGFSLSLYFDKTCQENRNAAAMRTDKWAGWRQGDVRGDLWGNPPIPKTFKQKLRNCLLDKIIYLDTMDLNTSSMTEFVSRINQCGIQVIFGHAHSIYLLAKFIDENKLDIPSINGIISTSMMLLDHERLKIETVFSCKVTNRYGCEEVGLIASECEVHDGMHVNMEHVIVELLDDFGHPVKDGEVGKVVVTDLNNFGMPLIRYQIEDMAVMSSSKCSCGRESALLQSLSGRVADFLKKTDGSMVAGISLIERTLTKIKGLEQIQLVQNELTTIEVNRVKASDYTERSDELLITELETVFSHDVKVIIKDIDVIPQMANGKYRFAICNL